MTVPRACAQRCFCTPIKTENYNSPGGFMLPRLLILSFLISTQVVQAAAQSSTDRSPFAFWSPQNGPLSPQEFRLHIPALSQDEKSRQPPSPLHWEVRNFPYIPFLPPKLSNHSITLAQNAAPCYTIRSYRFARGNPKSDSTSFIGYSTCQPGTEFHRKDAVNMPPR
jgi:hypothetical protein